MRQNCFKSATGLLLGGLTLVGAGWLAACAPAIDQPLPPTATPGPVEVWLDWPVDGAYPPAIFEIIAHAHDPSGVGLAEVQLWVNGEMAAATPVADQAYFVRTMQQWPADEPARPGDYILEVRAIDRNGRTSPQPGSARITIVEPEPLLTFEADQTRLTLGECTRLRWRVENVEQVKLNGEDISPVGDQATCPRRPITTYRLTGLSLAGAAVEQTITIEVAATPTPPPGVELTFEYDDSSYQGFGSPITLIWQVRNAQEVRLAGVDLAEQQVAASGSQVVIPRQPTNSYRLTVVSLQGEILNRKLTFIVPPTPTPIPTPTFTPTPTPTATFTRIPPTFTPTPTATSPADYWLRANRTTINQGEEVILEWHTSGIQAAFLNGGNINNRGLVGDFGAERDRPSQTATYVLTVYLRNGASDSRQVTVNVIPQGITPPSPQTPPPPTNIQGIYVYEFNGSQWVNYRRVTWNASPGATYYYLETQACTGCGPSEEFCTPVWADRVFNNISGSPFTFTDLDSCTGVRGGSGLHACNNNGCSSGVRWVD